MPDIKQHIDNLVDRLRKPKAHMRPILLPAKAVASPKETVEVQPFLVLCPSDIKTLVFSLFPERRSSAFGDKELPRSGLVSSASSISGISIPFQGSLTPGDGSSVLSQSVSSVTSDNTSRDLQLNRTDSTESLPLEQREAAMIRPVPTEDYGRKIRMACSEMSRLLGEDSVSGTCHPCADRWAVLHISQDGKQLLTRMRKDGDDEDDTEDEAHDSDSEDEGNSYGTDLEIDYHSLKNSVVRLLSEYELPKHLSDPKAFSNGKKLGRQRRLASGLRKATPVMDETSLKQLYQTQGAEEPLKERPSDLVIMLEAAYHQCKIRDEFVDAFLWHKTLDQLDKIASPSLKRNSYGQLLHLFARGPRDSLGRSFSAIEEFEAWFVWLKQSQERQDSQIEDLMLSFKTLRDKMWYKSAVLTSAGYEEARNVTLALKQMGKPPKTTPDGKPVTTHRRTFSKPSTTSIFQKSEAQILDLMAALPEHGGQNKLADEQVDITTRYLSQYSVESGFCKGEERIHRFCAEIDKCVHKLVGDGVLDGPVLWSSELYRRDKDVLDGGRSDFWLTGVGLIIPGNPEDYDTSSTRPSSMSLDFVQRPSKSSLKSISTQASQQSMESIDLVSSRPFNLMDAPHDYFGSSNPALAIDSTKTFWSPFSKEQSKPNNELDRRGSTASARSSISQTKTPAVLNEEKRRFLLDLKQTLTGLLLSDLGVNLFNTGSETDKWFSEEYADECLRRKAAEERKRQIKLARKKSMRSLKNARDQHKNAPVPPLPTDSSARGDRTTPTPSNPSPHSADSDHNPRDQPANLAGEVSRSIPLASTPKKVGFSEFPYNNAYRLLLRRFAIHPNPYAKLQALFELKLLIEQSLYARSGRSMPPKRDMLPAVPASPTLGATPELSNRKSSVPAARTQNLEEVIAHVAERRSHNMNATQGVGRISPHTGRVVTPPSTDMIVDVLQGLFRDASMRPKTLFRDLQFIAAFVPAQMLDKTARGKAFWDAGLAALGLKQDIVRMMVEIADNIVFENTQERDHAVQMTMGQTSSQPTSAPSQAVPSSSPQQASQTPGSSTSPSQRPRHTMADAAKMFLITAREGNAAAERELAIFYLTQPDLLPRTILPFSKPREVFKGELLAGSRGGKRGASNADADHQKSDPVTMRVAQHWMEMSRKGGDTLAASYLQSKDDMERIP